MPIGLSLSIHRFNDMPRLSPKVNPKSEKNGDSGDDPDQQSKNGRGHNHNDQGNPEDREMVQCRPLRLPAGDAEAHFVDDSFVPFHSWPSTSNTLLARGSNGKLSRSDKAIVAGRFNARTLPGPIHASRSDRSLGFVPA
ncbi:MAG: hypothetical protein H7A52_18450 [Akkermansiaceae bacterium]|nr:hypothetical protein [Akkermansiaceae bacterium]